MADELADETAAGPHADETAAWDDDGAGAAETTVVPPPTEAAPDLAWSQELDQPSTPQPWTRTWLIAVAILIPLAAVAAVIAIPRWVSITRQSGDTHPNSVHPVSPAAAGPSPVLDGTYQFDGHPAEITYRLKTPPVGPMDNKVIPSWWAFHSVCMAAGCAAHGALLDKGDHQRFDASNDTKDLTFVNGAWRDTNPRITTDACGNGKSQTVVHWSWELKPQPDGTLRGTATNTIASDGCGFLGNTTIMPISATRVGDAPPGLRVPSTVAPVAPPPDVPALPVQTVKTEDENLLAELADHGVTASEIHVGEGPFGGGAGGLITAAHTVCDMRTKGTSTAGVIAAIADPESGLGLPTEQAKWLTRLSIQTYCPQYEGN